MGGCRTSYLVIFHNKWLQKLKLCFNTPTKLLLSRKDKLVCCKTKMMYDQQSTMVLNVKTLDRSS